MTPTDFPWVAELMDADADVVWMIAAHNENDLLTAIAHAQDSGSLPAGTDVVLFHYNLNEVSS